MYVFRGIFLQADRGIFWFWTFLPNSLILLPYASTDISLAMNNCMDYFSVIWKRKE